MHYLPLDNMEFEDHRAWRQTRPPSPFNNYQVNYLMWHRQRNRHGYEEEWPSHEEGAPQNPLYSTPTPYIDHQKRDAVLQEADLYYRERQRYSPEVQLAHLWYPEGEPREQTREPPSLYHAPQKRTLRDELRETQKEHVMLQQSQQVIHADVAGLTHEVQANVRRLANTLTTLQQATPHNVSHCDPHHVHIEDEEEWPEPPSWPDTADIEEPSAQPMLDKVDQLMVELQLIKSQAKSASHRKQSPLKGGSQPPHPQPQQLNREPYPSYMASTSTAPQRHLEEPTSQPPLHRASTYTADYPPQ